MRQAGDNRGLIEAAAFRLFREVGYRLTSYSKIAEESGLGRPLVQYYFPKKEDLATGFILRVLEEITTLVKQPDDISNLGYITRVGQVYYSFLLADEAMRRLTLDLLSSRQMTSRVIEANTMYTVPFVVEGGADDERMVEASIKAVGGVYELMFRSLDLHVDQDPSDLSAQNVAAFMVFAFGREYGAALAALRPEMLSLPETERLRVELENRIFT